MSNLTEFQKEQILLIAKYHPSAPGSVENAYRSAGCSFDDTVYVLEHCRKTGKSIEGAVVQEAIQQWLKRQGDRK